MAWLLKVLVGPNQGAELLLEPGSFIIGSHEDCDIVLSDILVESQHAILKIASHEIQLENKAKRSFINGKKIAGLALVQAFDFLCMGSTVIVIGPQEEERWMSINAAQIPPLEEEKEELDPVEKLKSNNATETDPAQESSEPSEETASSAEKTTGFSVELRSKKKKKKSSFIKLSFLLIILLMLSLWLCRKLFNASKDTPTLVEAATAPVTPADQWIQDLKAMLRPPESLNWVHDQEGLKIYAYVYERKTKQELKKLIREKNPKAETIIYCNERLIEDCEEVMLQLKLPFVFSTSETLGNIKVTGYNYNHDYTLLLEKNLINEVKGLNNIEWQLYSPVEVVTIAKDILKKHKLNAYITPRAEAQTLLFSGILDASLHAQWIQAQNEINAIVGIFLPLRTNVRVVSPAVLRKAFLGTDIQSITLNSEEGAGESKVIATDGSIFIENSVLPSGYKITKISKDGVKLVRGEQEVLIPIEGV